MQTSQTPALLPLAFAASGTKNTIPETSQIGIVDGAASLPDGFVPLNSTPISSGGIPPTRADMNGILFMISAWARWQSAGGGVPYNSTFATDSNVGGYPKGARVLRSDGTGYWLNQTENNSTNPDTGGAGWVPDVNYGVTAITGLTNANVTLTAAQYAKGIITLAGTLTGNVQIIFPAIAGEWIVANNTTGAYTVTCKTAAGSGAAVARGSSSLIWGDGTNIYATLDGMGWAQIAAVATAAGLTPDPTSSGQLKSALDLMYSQNPTPGGYKNLQVSTTGTGSTISITADALVLSNGSGTYKTVTGVSLTINLANTIGQPLAISTGTWAANTWYALYVWNNGTSTTGTADPSATSPTAPAGYTGGTWMRVGWIKTDGTGNKYPLGFTQYGRTVQWCVAAGSNLTVWPLMATAQSWGAVGVSAFVPPTASRIRVQCQMLGDTQSFSAGSNSSTSSITISVGCGSGANYATATITDEIQLESSNIYFASNAYGIRSIGWEDNL